MFASSGQVFIPLPIVPLIYSCMLAMIQKLIKLKTIISARIGCREKTKECQE